MKRSNTTLIFLFCALLVSGQQLGNEDNHIKIDQFGYRPAAQKICIISNPQTGYNSNQPFTNPSPTYEVRRWNDNTVAFSGPITAWNGGATHGQSGDQVWWFDFSALQEAGPFYIYDPVKLKRSYRFEIDDQVYKNVLKQTVRSYYYQRCGHAKSAPHAQTPWTDGLCHQHAQQDLDCRLVSNPVVSTSKNLRGGWHDAGDYNKYTNFTFSTLTDLLLAYEENPDAWSDDFDLPESGNGKPDLLDEVKYELDWLLRMQNANGSVLSKVSVTDFSASTPPSADTGFRRYGAESTSSTLTAATLFALAAIQYQTVTGWTTYADTLEAAAIAAWNWADANPSVVFSNAGFSSANPEVSAYDRTARKVCAAAYLYALTGNTAYRTFFDNNYTSMHMMQWGYVYPFEDPYQDGLLYYTKIAGATSSVKNAILNTYTASVQTNNADNLPAFLNQTDAYRAYLSDQNTTWGSNQFRSVQANIFFRMNEYNLNGANAANYANAGQAIVNWIHGVNPTAYCFMSNMGAHGAEFSVPEFYHAWFADGSPLDQNPAPGFLPGGVNPSFAPDPACGCTISPPQNQPVQKSFKAWNTSWPENSWEITENSIYTQAAYIRALSKNVPAPPALPACTTLSSPANGATGIPANTALTWNPAAGNPTGYRIDAGTTPGGTDILNDFDAGNVTTYDPPGFLPYGTSVFVKIKPYHTGGTAGGCMEENFSTAGCIPALAVSDNPAVSGIFRSQGDLVTQNSTVQNGSTATFSSDTGVLLEVDFTVELGGDFTVSIEVCD